MLIGAKKQGYEIVGNIEWRPYYHTGTFEYNFPGSFMKKSLGDLTESDLEKCKDLDLIIGHTECGGFSNLRADKNSAIDKGDMGDIPKFIEAVEKLRPKFFVMDNLPKSLTLCDWEYWADNLPWYDIHFEWISNYGYGNAQKNRKRLFVIGSKKELGFYFIPGEAEREETVLQRISGIPEGTPNHTQLDLHSVYGGWGRYQFDPSYIDESVDANRLTLGELQYFIQHLRPGENIPYYNKKGEWKRKIGFSVFDVNRPAPTLSGGGACYDNHFRSDTLMPFTIRERARIQGCPDDFVFLPVGIARTCKEYGKLIKQTGKFMPVESCTYVTGLIMDFLGDSVYPGTKLPPKRTIKPNEYIDFNKFKYCKNIGYTSQEMVCIYCGSKDYCKKHEADQTSFENYELF